LVQFLVQIFHRKTRIDARSNGRLERYFFVAETGDEPTLPSRSNNRIALRAEPGPWSGWSFMLRGNRHSMYRRLASLTVKLSMELGNFRE